MLDWPVILAAIAGVLAYAWLRNNKRRNRTLAPLKEFAAECSTEIADYDAWENTLIGMGSNEENILFFIRSTPGGETREKINLTEVSGCRISKSESHVNKKKEDVSLVERISLNFSFHDHRPELILEFYNNDYDCLTLRGELQLAQKWAGLVTTKLSARWDWRVPVRERESQKTPISRPVANVIVYPKAHRLKRLLGKKLTA